MKDFDYLLEKLASEAGAREPTEEELKEIHELEEKLKNKKFEEKKLEEAGWTKK